MNDWIDLNALWKILVVGMLAGAGLPALFALGLRSLTIGGATTSAAAGAQHTVGRNPAGYAGAAVCFAVVLAGIVWGIVLIVNG